MLDPVLKRAFGPIDEWITSIDVFVLDVVGDGSFEFDGEPGFAMFSLDVLAGRILAPDDFQAMMGAVAILDSCRGSMSSARLLWKCR